jgi:hypothetical protein
MIRIAPVLAPGLAPVLALGLALAAIGCTGGESVFGPPTQAECPPSPTLTWNNFGEKFMIDYCTRCHDSNLRGGARQGAPSFHDFDTVFGVRAVKVHIDETTASGPAGTNEGMPPTGGKLPTLDERRQLGEWLACDAP